MSSEIPFTTHPASSIQGEFLPPGDKSISHRAVMISALASGISEFTNLLNADDCLRTIDAFKQMGVSIEGSSGQLKVHGVGFKGLKKPEKVLYLGNSGTTMRLLMGILAFQDFEATLTGDPSLSSRPMHRVTVPLRKMGAVISGRQDANFAPLIIRGGKLAAIHHVNDPASAQVKSAILLAGLQAEGETIVQEPALSRDHTERMLEMMGAVLMKKNHLVAVRRQDKLCPIQLQVPGDISSAAFFIVAAALVPNSDLLVRGVGLNPTRIGVLEVLKSMGAQIEWHVTNSGPEPVGDIHVQSSHLKAIRIGKEMIPRLIDELPILMIACALASGESVIQGAQELRVKETDRIMSMVRGLNDVGGRIREAKDGCVIEGVESFHGGSVSSFKDHRTAMSFIIAGLRSRREIHVDDVSCINTSYPRFFDDLTLLAH